MATACDSLLTLHFAAGTRVDYRVRVQSNYSPHVYGMKVVLKV